MAAKVYAHDKRCNDDENEVVLGLLNEGTNRVYHEPSKSTICFGLGLCITKLDEMTNSLVFVKKMINYPRRIRNFWGPILKLIFLGAIAGLFYYNYIASRESHYMSLSSDNGYCKQVAKSISGTYDMDFFGYWTDNSNFNPSRAKYYFTMNSFSHTESEYGQIVLLIKQAISQIGYEATSRTLADNLLYWMSWTKEITDTPYSHTLRMSGSIDRIFDRSSKQAVISSKTYSCGAIPIVDYNHLNGILTVKYSYTEYTNEITCNSISSASNLGYVASSDGDEFSLRMNMRTLMTALAVNKGVLDYSYLIDVHVDTPSVFNFTRPGYASVLYTSAKKTDERYPGMTPMHCYESITTIPSGLTVPKYFCTSLISSVYGYPFLTHKGLAGQGSYGQYEPIKCECGKTGNQSYCSTFDITAGAIIYGARGGSLLSESQQVENMLTMIVNVGGTEYVDTAVFDATFTGITLGNGKSSAVDVSSMTNVEKQQYLSLTNTTNMERNYDFCDGMCSIINLNFVDSNELTVNAAAYSLNGGSCANTFDLQEAYWDAFASTANVPTSLIEPYYKCWPTELTAFLLALGTTLGVATLLVAVITMSIMGLVAVCGVRQLARVPEFYDSFSKEKVLDELASYLLFVRDGNGNEEDAKFVQRIVTDLRNRRIDGYEYLHV
mmetsp:Transcript_32322/g.32945  ORF Transcript_32322/g.32945 Transcript_32322/m.32945 type:complete len:665 (-) Transcript_32322:18-2012(-)